MTDHTELIKQALKVRERSYSPYSGFMVGAALLCENGKVYLGANIENAAFTPTNCAERTAFFKAVSEGERKFAKIAVVGFPNGGETRGFAFPCGVCRQVMMEFCDYETFEIIVAKNEDEYKTYTLRELFPKGFGPVSLEV